MFQFNINRAARLHFQSVPRWQIAILSILGVVLGIILAIFMAGLMLLVVPIALVAGLLTRWFWGMNRKKAYPETLRTAQSSSVEPDNREIVIDAEYKVLDSESQTRP